LNHINLLAAALLTLAPPVVHALNTPPPSLADLSLEELANVEITSVSRRPERLSQAPASIYVITAEAIHRAGVTSLPEALRLAPNLQVARVNASQYAVSARGSNNANGLGNKLLVLIDGRTVYSSAFSGVFWDQQDLMLEDVERIEVISGPGATLWGANAVNGVINVITKTAADTPGFVAILDAGNDERGASFRAGGPLGDNGHFRAYAKTVKLNNTETARGSQVTDGMERNQIGFRSDWTLGPGELTLQGDAYTGQTEQRLQFTPIAVSGSNLLGRWTQKFDGGANLSVQTYYDHTQRDDAVLYRPEISVFDFEFQHGMPLPSQKLLWGGGYRESHDDLRSGLFFGFVPQSESMSWKNLFVQDEIALAKTVALTLGMKLEHNDFTGTEKLPSIRLGWSLSDNQLLWGAFSRAVRAPARLDRDIRLPPSGAIIAGGPNFVSEVANVYELGYRTQPVASFTYSATAFLHDWDNLRSGQRPPHAQVQNMIEGRTYGVEGWAAWQVTSAWRLSGGATTLRKDLHLKPGSTDPAGPKNLGNDPDDQWQLRSALNLPYRQKLDAAVRHVAALPDPGVPAYTAFDLRYAWQVIEGVELSLTGQNLLDSKHPEFNAAPGRSEIGRSGLLQLRLSL